jgi:hypothetical protein
VPSDDVAAARARLRDSLVRFDDALAPAFDPADWDMDR